MMTVVLVTAIIPIDIRAEDVHSCPTWSVCFSPDGKYILAAKGSWSPDRRGEVVVWEVQSWKTRFRWQNDLKYAVRGASISSDGSLFGAGTVKRLPDLPGANPYVSWCFRTWRLGELRELSTVESAYEGGDIVQSCFAPDNNVVALRSSARVAYVVDLKRAKKNYALHDPILNLRFSRDGKELICASYEVPTLRGYDTVTGKCLRKVDLEGQIANHLDLTPDGRLVATCFYGQIYLMNKKWEITDRIRVDYRIAGITHNCENRLTAICDETQRVFVRAFPHGELLCTLPKHQEGVNAMSISSDGKLLAVACGREPHGHDRGSSGIIRVWEIPSGKLVAELK